MSNTSSLCANCAQLDLKHLQVCHVYFNYELFVKSAAICAMCSTLLSAVRRANDQFEHESKFYAAKYKKRHRDRCGNLVSSSPRHLYDTETSVFSLSIALSKKGSEVACENISVRTTLKFSLDDQKVTTESEVHVFAPLNTMAYLGVVEDPDGVQLKPIALDARLQGEEKFTLMRGWLQRTAVPVPSDGARTTLSSSSGGGHCDSPSAGIISSRYPSRLIHITGGSNYDTLRLCLLNASTIFSGFESSLVQLKYATLSHRWGDSNHFTSTRANLKSRYEGFLVSEMPQTYQDAVIVACKLGLQFLWIDALCIIQNDAEDWHAESQKMGDVYQNSHVTIAAHAAGNDEEGFLSVALQKRETIRLGDSRPFFVALSPNLNADVTESQLCKRAWVLQERFLSPRIIHFTKGQLYWETIGEIRSEEGPMDANLKHFSPAATPDLTKLLHENTSTTSADLATALETPNDWFRLVEVYTRCGLTKEKDKLIAISGLAKRIHKKSGIGYLAGLWADKIRAGLLWIAEVEPLRKASFQRAPSWSWASVDGPIQYPVGVTESSFTPCCEVLEVTSEAEESVHFSIARTQMWMNGVGALKLRSDIWDLSQESDVCERQVDGILLMPGQRPLDNTLVSNIDKNTITNKIFERLREYDNPDIPNMDLKSHTRIRKILDRSGASGQKIEVIGWVAFDDESKDEEHQSISKQQASFRDRQLPNLCCALIGSSGPRTARVHYALFLTSDGTNGAFRRVGVGQLGYKFVNSESRQRDRTITIV